jgi:hypothetical protein
MGTKCVINVDLADVWKTPGRGSKKLLRTLAWGDEVVVTKQSASQIEVINGARVSWHYLKRFLP